MKTIQLSAGYEAVVDDGDYEWLSQWKWSMSGRYGIRKENKTTIFMHVLIHGVKQGHVVDHINGNQLDNRRVNLRFATRSQNTQNMRKRKPHSSIYKGVSFYTATGKWESYLETRGRKIRIGYFDTERTAALAYDLWAKDMFGDFACTNFLL